MALLIGSARKDENGNLKGGKAGDQTGKEVSTQSFYVHKKAWFVLRPKLIQHAIEIANRMLRACANPNIGYNQGNRYGVVKYGTDTKTKTECDCTSLMRQVVKEATGTDPGDFTTANEVEVLMGTGLFDNLGKYTPGMTLYDGDILVTCTKGHTAAVVSGSPRPNKTKSNDSALITFIKGVQAATGAKVDGKAGKETLSKTVTVSATINRTHAVVKPIQTYLNALGYNCGSVDGKAGPKFTNAVKNYQANVVGLKNPDGVITAQHKTWKCLLGIL